MQAKIFVCVLAVTAALLQPTATENVPEDNAATNIKYVAACEGSDGAQLDCPRNTLIVMHDALYGRVDKNHCVNGPGVDHKTCTLGPRALTIAQARCNNLQSCRLHTTHFPDPCFGVFKYLRVTYICRAFPTAEACGFTPLNIQCPAGKYIWIRSGFYGLATEKCKGPQAHTTCSLPNAKNIIARRCNNRESCEIRMMPDPCYGTLKYLSAAYECLDFKTSVSCDGALPPFLECPGNKAIRVTRGFNGRNTDEYCAYGPRHTYECSNPHAHQAIADTCNNKQYCRAAGAGPDPCPYTLKMTLAEYQCV